MSVSERIAKEILEQEQYFKIDSYYSTTLRRDSEGVFYVSRITNDGFSSHSIPKDLNSEILSYIETFNSLWTCENDFSSYETYIRTEILNHTPCIYPMTRTYLIKTFKDERDTSPDEMQNIKDSVVNPRLCDSDDIFKIEIMCSPVPNAFGDSTIYYYTQKPHQMIANVNSIEEYAKDKAQRTDMSEQEILNKDKYVSHYHQTPTPREDICSMVESPETRVKISDPLNIGTSGFIIDESEEEKPSFSAQVFCDISKIHPQ